MPNHPDKLQRLHTVFQNHPIYFITFCTDNRQPLLATRSVHHAFQAFAQQAIQHNVAFGRYVIMPDHIHLFVRIGADQNLSTTIRLLKRALSAAIDHPLPHWQPGFFDHVLRHSESYAEKWEYVYQNPVRAHLVATPADWPYQGQVIPLRF